MTIEKQVLEEYGQSMLDDFQSWDQEIKKAPKINIDNLLRLYNQNPDEVDYDIK